MSTEGNSEHNRAFEQLVSGDEDLIGFIAYALYKKDKRDFTLGWVESHGVAPQAEQVRACRTTVLTLGQQLRYRTAARDMLDAYAKSVSDAEKPLIERGAVTERFEQAAKTVEHSIRWYRQIPAGIVAGAPHQLSTTERPRKAERARHTTASAELLPC